jgi:hypothetical protein
MEAIPSHSEACEDNALVLVAQESKNFQTPEFLSAEAMGVDLRGGVPPARTARSVNSGQVPSLTRRIRSST